MSKILKAKTEAGEKRLRPLRKYWMKKLNAARESDNFKVGVTSFALGACTVFILWTISLLSK